MKQLTEGALFAGIMGFGEGFRRAGFKNLWAVEKEPFCQAVIRTRFPETELFTDVRHCGAHNLKPVDVLTAGFPCQDLSVAGKRAGLEGSRSGLFWEVVRILGELRPAWFVLENVPGLFSSGEGRDFAVVLNALDELGYGVAWRVLNSQFFGVAQRRRRVFIVGCFGKPCPQEVLFEPESGGWDSETGEEARSDIAVPLTSGIGVTGSSAGRRCEDDFNLTLTHYSGELAATLPACRRIFTDGNADNIVATALSSSAGHHGNSSPRGDGSDNLVAGFRMQAFGEYADDDTASAFKQRDWKDATDLICSPADTDGVRDFTELPAGMDSARYRALGNAVTTNVAQWIAERILLNC